MRRSLTMALLAASLLCAALPAGAAMDREAFLELCGSGSAAAVKEALREGAKVNVEGEDDTPLMRAVSSNPDPEVTRALLDAGADPGLKDSEGRTALDHARENEALKGTEALRRLEAAARGR